MGKGFWLDLSFLLDGVHVNTVTKLFFPDVLVSLVLNADERKGSQCRYVRG